MMPSWVILIAIAGIFFGIPILLIALGWGQARSERSVGGLVLVGLGMAMLLTELCIIVAYLMQIGPGRSGIIARGYSPEGREYCIVQTFKGFGEPYQVSFYIRDTNGIWHWNYLAHQDNAWRKATVDFKAGKGIARVSRGAGHFRDVPLPTQSVDLATVPAGYRSDYCPSNYTAEDVLRVHNQKNQWRVF